MKVAAVVLEVVAQFEHPDFFGPRQFTAPSFLSMMLRIPFRHLWWVLTITRVARWTRHTCLPAIASVLCVPKADLDDLRKLNARSIGREIDNT